MKIHYLIVGFIISSLCFNAFAAKVYTPADAKSLGIEKDLGRDERIKQHEENIKRILDERRKRREEELQKQREEEAKKNAAKSPQQPAQIQQGAKPGQPSQPAQQAKSDFQVQGPAEVSTKTNAILYILPLDIDKLIGETFVSWVNVFNESNVFIDELNLNISYDPNYLKPLKIYDSTISSKLKSKPDFKINQESGNICYKAKLKNPDALRGDPILKIMWETKKTTDFTEISFNFDKENKTYLKHLGKDVLGNQNLKTDGVIPASVMISQTDQKITRKREGNYNESFIDSPVITNNKGKIKLELKSDRQAFKAGEEAVIDVVLQNPNAVYFDSMKLWIKFDPNKFEAVDWDTNNWIKTGINAYDGFARKTYPFDFHKRNVINNEKGEIDYRMGISTVELMPSGTFLKLKFNIKEKAFLKDIYIMRAGTYEVPNTSLTFLGKEIIDKSMFAKKNDFEKEYETAQINN